MLIFKGIEINILLQSETIRSLTALVEKQALQIDSLIFRFDGLETLVVEQQEDNKGLEQVLSVYKNKKNCGNSHIPRSVCLSRP